MDGDAFRAYVEQILAPCLRPGDVVVMDNLSAHKVAGVRQATKARGAFLLYLPAYSPDLNPIEQAFAKLKALLRKAAARSKEALWQVIAEAINQFDPTECRNFFLNVGWVQINLKCSRRESASDSGRIGPAGSGPAGPCPGWAGGAERGWP